MVLLDLDQRWSRTHHQTVSEKILSQSAPESLRGGPFLDSLFWHHPRNEVLPAQKKELNIKEINP